MRCAPLLVTLAVSACAAPRPEPARAEPVRAEAAPATDEPEPSGSLDVWEFLRAKYDRDGSGSIELAEYARGERAFGYLDADRDGAVTVADFADEFDRPREWPFTWGEGGPELGDPAPEIELRTTEGQLMTLSSFRGKVPVALVFGSFT